MNTTPQLIDSLTRDLAPVRPLRRPLLRCAIWLGLAAIVLALAGTIHGLRADLDQRLADPDFLLALGSAAATGILAAIAAFFVSLPDRSRYWLLLPVPTLFLWMTTLGHQCITEWVAVAPDGSVVPGQTAQCFMLLALTGLPLQAALLIMLRYAAVLQPIATAVAGCLAVAAFTATILLLANRDLDATAVVLLWNLLIAGAIVALWSAFGLGPHRTPQHPGAHNAA